MCITSIKSKVVSNAQILLMDEIVYGAQSFVHLLYIIHQRFPCLTCCQYCIVISHVSIDIMFLGQNIAPLPLCLLVPVYFLADSSVCNLIEKKCMSILKKYMF